MSSSGLPKLNDGIAKAWREVWDQPCQLKDCGQPAAGAIEALAGPKPICEGHIPGAEARGYAVRRRENPDPVGDYRAGLAAAVRDGLRAELLADDAASTAKES